jgi:environmental stress-induced protein Ves
MNWRSVSLASVPPQPWKNGGGTTRELLAWPAGADWRVRLSVAEVVADGPFSRFEGVQRWFAVLRGAGVRLVVDGVAHTVTATDGPLAFGGAADTCCTLLGGPTQDFNLMLRGGSARVQRVQGQLQVAPSASQFLAVYTGNEMASVVLGAEAAVFPPHTLLWRDVSATHPLPPITLDAPGALWMEISP